jgi:hypothetical protein
MICRIPKVVTPVSFSDAQHEKAASNRSPGSGTGGFLATRRSNLSRIGWFALPWTSVSAA